MREKRCFHFDGGGRRENQPILKLWLDVEKLVILCLRDGQKSPWVSFRFLGRAKSLLGVSFRPGGGTNSNLRVTSRSSLYRANSLLGVNIKPWGRAKVFLGYF